MDEGLIKLFTDGGLSLALLYVVNARLTDAIRIIELGLKAISDSIRDRG